MKTEEIILVIVLVSIGLILMGLLFYFTIVNNPFLSGNSTNIVSQESGFTLKYWKPVVKKDTPYLYVSFETDKDIKMELFNPDGILVDEKSVREGETGTYLKMNEETSHDVISGTYRLVVKDQEKGVKIFEKSMTFNGSRLVLIDIDLEHDFVPFVGTYLSKIYISISNVGDLPVYLKDIGVYVDGKLYDVIDVNDYIDVLGTYYLNAPVTSSDTVPENYVLELRFYNDNDEVIYTYTADVSR